MNDQRKQAGARPFSTGSDPGRDALNFFRLKDPKGGDLAELPSDLNVREFPASAKEVVA